MKLEIKIDTAIVEPETVITTSAMTDEVNRAVNYISNLVIIIHVYLLWLIDLERKSQLLLSRQF